MNYIILILHKKCHLASCVEVLLHVAWSSAKLSADGGIGALTLPPLSGESFRLRSLSLLLSSRSLSLPSFSLSLPFLSISISLSLPIYLPPSLLLSLSPSPSLFLALSSLSLLLSLNFSLSLSFLLARPLSLSFRSIHVHSFIESSPRSPEFRTVVGEFLRILGGRDKGVNLI